MTRQAAATIDGRRARGEATRRAILAQAVAVASSEGLEAVSLQRLADELGISKSGLFARFGSREQLQLATIEEAGRRVWQVVASEALSKPRGVPRLWALADRFLAYLAQEVFPGGCVIASLAAEYDSRPGPLRDAVIEQRRAWLAALERAAGQAIEEGHLRPDVDVHRLAWEIDSFLQSANFTYQMERSPAVFELARAAIRSAIARATEPLPVP